MRGDVLVRWERGLRGNARFYPLLSYQKKNMGDLDKLRFFGAACCEVGENPLGGAGESLQRSTQRGSVAGDSGEPSEMKDVNSSTRKGPEWNIPAKAPEADNRRVRLRKGTGSRKAKPLYDLVY